MKILPEKFYNRQDVTRIAKDLIGKLLVTRLDDQHTSGRIIETEAYAGVIDKASHAYGGRRTRRTEIMFGPPGFAYVYLCYGIHHLFNIVTNKQDVPHAVLIRALEPVEGIELMMERSKKISADFTLTRGPGNVSRALGIRTTHTGLSLLSDELFVADDGFRYDEQDILASPRIGVDYAGEDAMLPYRYFVRNNRYVSGKKTVHLPSAG